MNHCPFFNCQRCRAPYHVVEVAPARKPITPRRKIVEAKGRCRLCGEPLPRSEGPSMLRYFLLPTTALTKQQRRQRRVL
jgi:hypothetical protein